MDGREEPRCREAFARSRKKSAGPADRGGNAGRLSPVRRDRSRPETAPPSSASTRPASNVRRMLLTLLLSLAQAPIDPARAAQYFGEAEEAALADGGAPVSYTHLTLPTTSRV